MTNPISISVKGMEQVRAKLTDTQWGAKGIVAKAIAEYMIGDTSHGLTLYPPPRPAQKYVRTYNLRGGWKISGESTNIRITNSVSYSPYVVGNDTQAWMHAGRWRTIAQNTAANMQGALRHAQAVLNEWLRSRV